MHKVTIDSPDTNTKQTMEYKAILFVGIRNDSREGIECMSLGKKTNDPVEDAVYKTRLLAAIHKLQEQVIKSNDMLQLVSILDPDFATKFKSKALTKDQYELSETIRRILDEGKE